MFFIGLFGLCPSPGNNGSAIFASIFVQVISLDEISDPFNEQFLTIVAIRVASLGIGGVAHIDIMDSFSHGQLAKPNEG